jgi:hypothetical protein
LLFVSSRTMGIETLASMTSWIHDLVWHGHVFGFFTIWIWPNWNVGWEVAPMNEMFCIVWLAKSAKSGDGWWSWEFEEDVISYLLFFYLCGVLFANYELWCVVLHGLTSFDVDLCGVLHYVWTMCIMKRWTKLYKGRCFKCCGGRLIKFITTISLLWGSWTISF